MDWRADTAEGFTLAREVFEAFHPVDPAFGMEEALDYLDRRPDLVPMRAAAAA
jgi:spore coat polysaccharide biosynthesis protein SpsF (cytidylyltransferase family)